MKILADLKRLFTPPAHGGPLLALLAVLLPAGLRAAAPGTLDTTYQNPETDSPVQVVVAQKDASGVTRAIIGGDFGTLPGFGNLAVPGLARFDATGSLDTDFAQKVAGIGLTSVTAVALQPDGKILVAGHNTGGNVLLRLAADGTPETAFHVTTDDDVESIAFQSNGSILIAGFFSTVNGTGNQRCLARLSTAGVLDTAFQAYANSPLTVTEVKRVAVLPAGGILTVTHFSEGDVDRLIQLAATDGSVPTTPLFYSTITGGRVYDLNVDSGGRVVIVGNFDTVDSTSRESHIARFSAAGVIDANFVGGEPLPSVLLQSVVVDAKGQPLVGGVSFFTPALFRLTADTGAMDTTFSFPLGEQTSYVQSLALQPDGALLAAGQFQIGQAAATLIRVVTGVSGTAPTSGSVLVINSDDFTYTVKGQPNTGTVVPGDKITYSLVVRNTGTAPATNVVVTATYNPTYTKLVQDGISNDGFPIENIINWTLPKINNGDHVVLTYTVKVKAGVDAQAGFSIGSQVLSAKAAAPAVPASGSLPNITLRIIPAFSLSVSNDGATARAGGPLTFTFTVVNRGANTVTNINADVHLPDGYAPGNFKGATLIDDNGTPFGPTYKLGVPTANGGTDGESVRVPIASLAAGASQRFIITVNVPVSAVPGSKVNLPTINLNGSVGSGIVSYSQTNYAATISNQPPLAAPSITVLKFSPTASNLQTFLSLVNDPSLDKKSYLAKSAKQFFLALALYEGQTPEALEAMQADQLARLLNPYVSHDTDPDSGDSLYDVPSPNAKQPDPSVTYLLLYFNTGDGDAAGITINDSVPAKLALDPASISIKGLADVKTDTVGADGRSLTFTFGKVTSGTGGLIVYKANVPAPSAGGPNLGDIVFPTPASLTTASLSVESIFLPTENLLITGAANAFVSSNQADVGDGSTNYTIYYKNTGGEKSKDFIVVSMVPTGGAFVSADFLAFNQSVRAADGAKGEHIDTLSAGATSGRVAFHLGKVKPRGEGFVRVTYKVTNAALALKPAGLVHHYYVAGGSFPDATTNAMRGDRPVPAWARRDEHTRVARQGGDPRFGIGDVVGIFKQGFDNVTHAIGNFFAKPGTPQPAGVAPTLWLQRIAPLAVQENTTFQYVVTVGNSGGTTAHTVICNITAPSGATLVSGTNGSRTTPSGDNFFFALDTLAPGQTQSTVVTYRATAAAGATVESSNINVTGYADDALNYFSGLIDTGRTSSLVYSAQQAGYFASLQTAIATNAAQAGGIDPSALASNPKYAAHVAAITPNSTQTAIAHADFYTTTNGLTLVAQGGGNLVAQGGGNVLVSGPSNLVAQGGGNLVAQGGGNLVAQGGGNLTFNNIPGFGATVTASTLLSPSGVATLVAQGGGNLVAQGGGNLVAQGGGNLITLSGAQFAISTLTNANTFVAGAGNVQALGLVSDAGSGLVGDAGSGLVSDAGSGLVSEDGTGLVSQTGGGLKFVGGASSLIGQDGGGFHRTNAVGGRFARPRASTVQPGTLLGSPANSVSLDFNSAGGMVFGVGGSRANGQ